MTGRERILTTIHHEEPDRVPISPRIDAWLNSNYGSHDLQTHLKNLPDMDPMFILYETQQNYLKSYPDKYDLPEVDVDQKKYKEDNYLVVERTFETPAGQLSDCTKIPPSGGEYGVFPNPIKTEFLIKSKEDLCIQKTRLGCSI